MKPAFEWDSGKAADNFQKHGVSFEEAKSVFADPLALNLPDPEHSIGEERLVVIGRSYEGRVLFVAFTERGSRIRIISAREAARNERRAYERGA